MSDPVNYNGITAIVPFGKYYTGPKTKAQISLYRTTNLGIYAQEGSSYETDIVRVDFQISTGKNKYVFEDKLRNTSLSEKRFFPNFQYPDPPPSIDVMPNSSTTAFEYVGIKTRPIAGGVWNINTSVYDSTAGSYYYNYNGIEFEFNFKDIY